MPTPAPTGAPSSHNPSPSGMPDTTTGGPGSSDDGSAPLVLLGLVLLVGSFSYAIARRLGFLNPLV
jgi:hypothetical protein